MIGVAVVGLGWWGAHIVRTLEDDARLHVTATVDPDPGAGATSADLDDVLADPAVEAVILCTPHSLHEDQIVRCAAAGKHVFCEKPLALSAAAAARAVAACRTAGVALGVGHERRFEPAMAEIRRMAAEGELGTILHAEAAFSHDKFVALAPDSWRGSEAEAPAAGMTGMGVHLTDLFISMLGPVAEVHAFVARRVLALPTGDVVSVHLRFESGATASMSAISATPFYGRFAMFGSSAWVETRDEGHPEVAPASHLLVQRAGQPSEELRYEPADPVRSNLAAFADAVEGHAPYPFSDQELVLNVAVLEAVARSAAAGRPVGLSEVMGQDPAETSRDEPSRPRDGGAQP